MRLIKKIILGLVFIIISAIIVFAIAYNMLQSKMQSKVEALVNETIEGEVKLVKLEFSLFSSYPKMIIDIDTLLLREKRIEGRQVDVLKFLDLHLQIDVSEAIKGVYLVDQLKLGGGEVNIITYGDSSINLLNAVSLLEEGSNEDKDDNEVLKVQLTEMLLGELNINYDNQVANQKIYSKLEKLYSKIILEGDSLIADLDLNYTLDSFVIENKRILKNQKLTYKSALNGDLSKLLLKVTNGKIKLNLLEANIDGLYNGGENGLVDFKIWARHTDLSELAKMDIFKEENLPDINNGELEINASVKGHTMGAIPLIKGTASLKNLEVYNQFGKVIDKAGFNLSFKSLSRKNFNDSHIVIDSISIDLSSGGYFRGRANIDHLNKPKFNITWEASEQLENIDKLIKIPKVKSISGRMITKGNYAGTYTIKSQMLSDYSGACNVTFSDVNLVLKEGDYSISNINGLAYMINGDVGLENLSFSANSNALLVNGKIENAVPFALGEPVRLTSSIAIKSNLITTETLLAFDTALADSNKYIIRNLDVNLQADLASKALDSYKLIPTGKLTVYNFTALLEGAPPITEFNGVVETNQKLIAIKNFSGIIGKSHVDFGISISNYTDFLQSDTEEQMVVDVSLKSEQINVKDFFTVGNKFILPKSYEEEVLKDVAVNTKIITTNLELQKTELLPEFELQVTGLQFRTLYTPVTFKDIFVFGLVKDNNVYINSMFGKFGRSDVFMNAEFDNVVATKDTITRPLVSRVTFNSGVLDLNELIKLDDSTSPDEISDESISTNPFADKFPITEFQVNIGELNYYDATIKQLSGLLKIEENNYIHLHEIKLQSGEYGTFEFEGELDASSREEAILNSTIKITDVDLSKLNVTYTQDDKEVRIRDHFEGMVNGEIIANVPILQDFSIDLARLTGKVKVRMTNGALINYAPLEEMGNYFKNKDLTKVRFDTLKNTMIFNVGKILLPFMTINTTLGTINLMGFQNMENDMEYDIQVPIKLVAGSVLNSLFSSKKGDDENTDEIKKGGKGKYVTVHISGSDEGYKFKLGKKHVLSAPPGFKVD